MKKYLIAIAMVLTLSQSADAAAQKHRHTPRTELADTARNSQDAIEAFSDTTSVGTTYSYGSDSDVNITLNDENVKALIAEALQDVTGKDIAGVFIVLGVLFILFVLFPIILIIGVVWLINKNRKDKLKLAQMAMQNGQPIPEQLFEKKKTEVDGDDYNRGMRQLFLGVGLMIFLGFTAGETGFAIGALVFFIGLGKVVIAKTSQRRNADSDFDNHSNNPSDI